MNEIHPPDEVIAAYSNGRLDAAEVDRLERHLLVCSQCRQTVTLAMAIRRHHKARRNYWIPAALAAAVLLTVLAVNSDRNPYKRFGLVKDAPPYGGIPVRADRKSGDSTFLVGMSSYKAGNFSGAVTQLRQAREQGADSMATTFFAGAALLLEGQPVEAGKELSRSARMEGSPYAGESHYYRAKALLQINQPDIAIAELKEAVAKDNVKSEAARALLDSIAGIRPAR